MSDSLPKKELFTLCVMLFSSSFSLTMLFPFIGPMVKQLGVVDDEREYGFYAGYVASAFMVGRMLSSYPWGRWSDRHGRVPVMAFGCASLVFTSAAFGFSFSYSWAIIVRLICGLTNGVVGTAKACVAELCPPDKQAQGMTLITATWGLGLVIGPALGGVLSEPADKWPDVFDKEGLFGQFPFLIPCLISSLIGVVGWYASVRWFPETLPASTRRAAEQRALANPSYFDWIYRPITRLILIISLVNTSHHVHVSSPNSPGLKLGSQAMNKKHDQGTYGKLVDEPHDEENQESEDVPISHGIEMTQLIHSTDSDDESDDGAMFADVKASPEELARLSGVPSSKRSSSPNEDTIAATASSSLNLSDAHPSHTDEDDASHEDKSQSHEEEFHLSKSRSVIMVIALYAMWSMVQIMINEVLPLWILAPKSSGGLGKDTTITGTVFGGMGALLLFFQLFIYSRLSKMFGPLRLYTYATMSQLPLTVCIPFIGLLKNDTAQIAVLILASFLRQATATTAFTSNFILINNSVPQNYRGAVNGLGMTVGSFGKAVGPSIGSVVFAWTLTNGLSFPLDFHFLFILCSILAALISLSSLLLPRALNQAYEIAHPSDEPVTDPKPHVGLDVPESVARGAGSVADKTDTKI